MAGQSADLYALDDSFDTRDDERIVQYGATQETPPMRAAKTREVSDAGDDIDVDIPLQEFQQYREQVDPLLLKKEKKKTRSSSPSYSPLQAAASAQSLANSTDSAAVVSTRSFGSQEKIDTQRHFWYEKLGKCVVCLWLRHPKVKENWRVLLGSLSLTVIGCVLIIIGVGIVISPQRGLHCLVFFVIGLLCFIPGVYHLVYIYYAVKGRPGYDFYGLPAFK